MSIKKNKAAGFTLIELVMIIIIVAIVAVGILGVFQKSVVGSADPMLRMQSLAIAQAYLEEILLQEYDEPPGGPAESGTCEAGETRPSYDDVLDYLCIAGPAAPQDQFANGLPALAAYNVTIAIVTTNIGLGGQLAAARQVTVSVVDPAGQSLSLVGYRANY